jgi:hypothetical protein
MRTWGRPDTGIVGRNSNAAASISAAQIGKLQMYYRAHGCAPEVVGEGIVDAVRGGRSMLLVRPYARLMVHLKRISRMLVRDLTLSDAKKNGFI